MVFGGHGDELDEFTAVFDTLDFGENQSVLVSGLRGCGKTSMLLELQERAAARGWMVIGDDASAGLMDRVMTSAIPAILGKLAPESRRRLTELGIWHFSAKWDYVERDRSIKPLLRRDLLALSGLLIERREPAGILITIDEVSSGKTRLRELGRFALEISHAISGGANVMVVFAGIKVDLDALVEQEHTTFLRRSRELAFHRLSPAETEHVLVESTRIAGKRIKRDALELLVATSQGYPYLVQLVGDYAWRAATGEPEITENDAELAHFKAIAAVERRVISRVYSDLSPKDREFVEAMAVDEQRSRIADIARRMDVSDQYVQVYKKRLIDSGYVQRDGRGYVAFSLPYLGDYIRSRHSEPDDPPSGWDSIPPPLRG